jgi:hypothetical protein
MHTFRAVLISIFITSTAFATTWTVDDEGKADFDNIQAAVNAASNGDEILVMPGTYTGSGDEVVEMLGKAVWLHSSDGPEVTIIDGEGVRRVFFCYSGETNMTIIEGMTILGGFASGDYPNSTGGGIRNQNNSNPTMTNCIFTSNNAGYGGGMYNNSSSPLLTNCTFTDNTGEFGGGMRNASGSNPMLTNCTFTGNTADYGGGMYSSISNPTLINTLVCGNTLDQINGDYTDGGGNTIADVCPIDCPSDINGDGYVNVSDLLTIIDQWGLTNSQADVNQDGIVDVSDLLIVISNWGPCE